MNYLYRCWAEVRLDYLRFNLNQLKSGLKPGVKTLAVVKADAYGHGAKAITANLEPEVDWFAVATLNEARQLRSYEITKPILVLGPTFTELLPQAVRLDITQTVVSLEQARQLSAAATRLGLRTKAQVKVDTGMSRFGFSAVEMERTIAEICEVAALPGLELNGIYTHFSAADEDTEFAEEFTKRQCWLFETLLKHLELRGVLFPLVHCCNSAGMLNYPEMQHTMVRAGIALYGHYPDGKPTGEPELKPVLSLKARIAQLRDLRAGEFISYGCSFRAKKDMKIAVVSAGYADGIPRILSNRAYVCTTTGIAPIVGKICMDCFIIDVSDIPNLKEGDVVTVFGNDSPIPLCNLASSAGTISYEMLCNISRRVPRIYLDGQKTVSITDYTGSSSE